MSTVAVTRLIDAPPERVWRVFTDLSARTAWLSTVDAVEVLTADPFGAGTRWRETRATPDGTLVTEEFRVEEAYPLQRFTVMSPGIGADYRTTYAVTPVEVGRHRGGTLVTVIQEGSPTTPYGRLLALVFGGLAARAVEGALRRDLTDLAAAAVRVEDDPVAA
jgi:uncharacterized protein YndB with AHSA1/START domain